jgi:hypothetical protein
MQKIKHSKIRNTGLLSEFLLRQITADVLNNENKSKAIKILKKRFNENTELGKELALYNIIINKKFQSDKKAGYFINEVLNQRQNLNSSELKREKYNLIKELKEIYNLQKFLSSKVNNYRIYASIYKLFEYSNSISADEKTESYFNLVEHITTKKDDITLSETLGGNKLPNDEDLRILTYRTLLEKFNQKYSKLNLPQKSLLRTYINNVSNTNSLKEYIEKVVPVLKKDLKKYSKNVQDDIVKIKLKESINHIDKFCTSGRGKSIKDSNVVQTMRYMELLKELKKSGSKNKKTL